LLLRPTCCRPTAEQSNCFRAAYVAKVKAAADALLGERLLLPADVVRYVHEAERSDRF
jgi:hypothetical protein